MLVEIAVDYKTGNISEVDSIKMFNYLASIIDLYTPASLDTILWYIGGEAAVFGIKDIVQADFGLWLVTSAILALLTALCYHYHTSNFGRLPEIYCKEDSELHSLLRRHVKTINRPYKPPIWCAESRFQTIVRYFTPYSSKISWKREIVVDKEGGMFYLNWFENKNSTQFPESETRPTVFIVPGLTSTCQSSYIASMIDCLAERGYRILVLVYRGLEDMELKTPLTYCATYTADVERSIDICHRKYPKSDIHAIGASLGSSILGRYLSMKGDESHVKAAMLFSCPFKPEDCIKELETPSNLWLMNYNVTQNVKGMYMKNCHVFEGIVDKDKIKKSFFLREFDEHFTVPVFGYASLDEYYKDASLVPRLTEIKVPTLCVGANDDPFSPQWALPAKEITKSEKVAMVMTYGGGHVSHIQEGFPFCKSYFELIMEEFFDAFSSAE